MSNNVNTELLERASDMIGYFENNSIANELQTALNSGDLDAVRKMVVYAEAEAARAEIYGREVVATPMVHVFERSQWSDNCVCADCYGDFSGASYDEWGGR